MILAKTQARQKLIHYGMIRAFPSSPSRYNTSSFNKSPDFKASGLAAALTSFLNYSFFSGTDKNKAGRQNTIALLTLGSREIAYSHSNKTII